MLAATAVVAVLGWVSFRQLTVEAFPDPTDTQVQVITLYPGQPSEEVERQIGLPLERALNGTPGLARLRNRTCLACPSSLLPSSTGSTVLLRGPRCSSGSARPSFPTESFRSSVVRHTDRRGYRYTLEGAGGDHDCSAPSKIGWSGPCSSGPTAWPTWSATGGVRNPRPA